MFISLNYPTLGMEGTWVTGNAPLSPWQLRPADLGVKDLAVPLSTNDTEMSWPGQVLLPPF